MSGFQNSGRVFFVLLRIIHFTQRTSEFQKLRRSLLLMTPSETGAKEPYGKANPERVK